MDKPGQHVMATMASKAMMVSVCVAVAAAAAVIAMMPVAQAGEAAPPATAQHAPDLAGRWHGQTYELQRRKKAKACGEEGCQLTLDISACGDGWCGVEVADAGAGTETCRATALKLDGGKPDEGDTITFRGKLELAEGAEPYTVVASVTPAGADDPQTYLSITGDTGGKFCMFRRTFPFETSLARSGDAHCKPDKTVKLLDQGERAGGMEVALTP